jgi:hypothetical protein
MQSLNMTKQKLVSLIKEVIQEQTEEYIYEETFDFPNNIQVKAVNHSDKQHTHLYFSYKGKVLKEEPVNYRDGAPQKPEVIKNYINFHVKRFEKALKDEGLIAQPRSAAGVEAPSGDKSQAPAVQRRGPGSERRVPRRERSDYKNDPFYKEARADYLRAVGRVKDYNQQSDSLSYKQELIALKSAKRDALASFEAFRKLLEKYPNVKIDYLVKFSNDKVVRLQPKDPKETLNHYKKNIRTISKVLIELEDRSKRRRRYRRARPIFLRKFRKYKQPFKDRYKGLNKDAFDKFYLDLEAKDLGFLLGKRGRDYQFGKKHEFAFMRLLQSGTPNMIDISPVIIRTA